MSNKPEDEINNRAGLKVMRLATLAAVSEDYHSPLISVEHVSWAIKVIEWLDGDMLKKFSSGEVGSAQVKQEAVVLKAAKKITELSVKERLAKGMVEKVAAFIEMIPLADLKDACVNHNVFANDRLGAVTSFEKCVDSMIKAGKFGKVETAYAADTLDHMNGMLLCLK